VAFTTQEGTGGAPWTFQGTPEDDAIAVITGNTQDTASFDFLAEGFEGNDVINWNGTRSVTIRGGQGDDLITNNIAASAALTSIITSSFINGNDGADVIGNSQVGLLATLSTVSGGQADDEIFIGSLQSSKVNGNRGEDFIEVGDIISDENVVATLSNFNNASIFGGQGDDIIEVVSEFRDITNSVIAGQIGDDTIGIQLGQIGIDLFGEIVVESDPSFAGSVVTGNDGDDLLDASGLLVFGELLQVSAADLVLEGGEGDDSAFGGAGSDEIFGDDGADWLSGYANDDEIFGGKGNDVIIGAYYDGELEAGFIGDAEGDLLSGGTGANRFYIPGSYADRTLGLGSTGFVTFVEDQFDFQNFGLLSQGDEFIIPNGADVITDWNAGAGSNAFDTLLPNTLANVFADPFLMSLGAPVGGLFDQFANVNNFAVRGQYSEFADGDGLFVISEFGTDIAVWTDFFGFDLVDGLVSNFTVIEDAGLTTTITPNQFVTI